MKTKSLLTPFATSLLVASLLFSGCKKEDSNDVTAVDEEQAVVYSSESEGESEFAFDDVYNNVLGVNDEVGTGGTGVFGRVASPSEIGRTDRLDSVPACVTVTIVPMQPGVYPKTVTIDFGAGCFTRGHLRSGKIKTVFTGRLIVPGSTATTTFENYKIDSTTVAGIHKITNSTAGTPNNNQRQFTIEVTDGKLTKPSGNYVEWNSRRVRTQVEGNGSVVPADDVFRVTGGANGKVKRGARIYLWNAEITEPIIKSFSCNWISKGRIRLVRVGLAANSPWVSVVDFGNGTCDNQATLIINGVSRQITLQ